MNLQVGANTSETLGVDLLPPGFSVEALGLEDFTVRGIEGDVTPKNTLTGRAKDIELYPQDPSQTSVTYTGVVGSEPTLRQKTNDDGSTSYYVSTLDDDNKPRFYDTGTPVARVTASDSSTVSVTGTGLLYTASISNEPAQNISDITFNDAGGNALEGSARLLQSDGRYLIEQTSDNGSVRYYEAALDFMPGEGAALASGVSNTPIAEQTCNAVSDIAVDGTSYSLSDVSPAFQNGEGELLSSADLVENDGNYYVLSQLDGETVYYRLGGASATTENVSGVDETTLTLQADTTRAVSGDDFADADNVTALPAIDFSSSPTMNITNADGDVINGNARLMQRTSTDQYMVEVDDGAGSYHYYETDVAFSMNANGDVQVNAQARETATATFNLNERVDKVVGSSTITLDPRNDNVTVNYTDSNGERFSDVLRQREDGNYYFDLPGATQAMEALKWQALSIAMGIIR